MLSRSRYHVPLQSFNVGLTFVGAYLGHHHHGRMFPATASRAPCCGIDR